MVVVQDGGIENPKLISSHGHSKSTATYGITVSEDDLRSSRTAPPQQRIKGTCQDE